MFSNPMEDFEVADIIVKALDIIFILHADHE
jgi:citrate synthase